MNTAISYSQHYIFTNDFEINFTKKPGKGIFSVRICILNSKSYIQSTRKCLKYVNVKTENDLKEHGTLIIVMKIHCFVLFCLCTIKVVTV